MLMGRGCNSCCILSLIFISLWEVIIECRSCLISLFAFASRSYLASSFATDLLNDVGQLRQNTAFLASKEAEIAALASLKTLESQIAEERRLWGEARSKLEADLCNSRVRLVALESELKFSKESLAIVQREFHDAREAWEHMVEEALIDMREDHEQEKERLVEMLMAKSIKAKEPTQESPSQAIPQDFRGQTNKDPDEVPNT